MILRCDSAIVALIPSASAVFSVPSDASRAAILNGSSFSSVAVIVSAQSRSSATGTDVLQLHICDESTDDFTLVLFGNTAKFYGSKLCPGDIALFYRCQYSVRTDNRSGRTLLRGVFTIDSSIHVLARSVAVGQHGSSLNALPELDSFPQLKSRAMTLYHWAKENRPLLMHAQPSMIVDCQSTSHSKIVIGSQSHGHNDASADDPSHVDVHDISWRSLCDSMSSNLTDYDVSQTSTLPPGIYRVTCTIKTMHLLRGDWSDPDLSQLLRCSSEGEVCYEDAVIVLGASMMVASEGTAAAAAVADFSIGLRVCSSAMTTLLANVPAVLVANALHLYGVCLRPSPSYDYASAAKRMLQALSQSAAAKEDFDVVFRSTRVDGGDNDDDGDDGEAMRLELCHLCSSR